MTNKSILKGNKIIARYLGYEYIPHNNKDGLKPGWWKLGGSVEDKKRLQTLEPIFRKVGESRFLCRNHKGLRFYNSWDWLIEACAKCVYEPSGSKESIRYWVSRFDRKETFTAVVNFIKSL